MIQSFYTGNAGLNANQKWLSVISDNIANVNTIGFKAERANFEDLIASSITSFANNSPKNLEIGGGSFIGSTTKNFTQGALKNTNIATDLALDGEGFFMVKDKQGVTYFTRAGQFRTDANGDLINLNGMYLQGWALDENGNISGSVGKINIPNAMDPHVTSKLALKSPTNLDASSPLIGATFDTSDATTYSYVNAITVYDSLGVAHEAQFYFVHENPNQWRVFGLLDDEPIQFKVPSDPNTYDSLLVEFNGVGQINSIKGYGVDSDTSSIQQTVTENAADNGQFALSTTPVRQNSIIITDFNGTPVNWADDGSGNIIDLDTSTTVGSVNYSTGIVTINAANGSSAIETIRVSYNAISAENADLGRYTLANTPVLPGSLVITEYTVGGTPTTVNWIDDGHGNIIDLNDNNKIIGSISYDNGAIAIDRFAGSGSIEHLTNVRYKTYNNTQSTNTIPADQISMVPIPTNNPNSATLNTGGNPIQFTLNVQDIKQVASDFIFYAEQDGYSKGDLLSVSVSEDGLVKGVYSNGQVRDWARIAIATFKDKEILVRKGNNLFLPNSQTYTPIIVPGGVISKIRGGFLELSNVDISKEFINLIAAQRAYQANARTITTTDQVLQETMNLKR